MRPIGRRTAVLVGLIGIITLISGSGALAAADTLKAEVDLSTKDIGSKENVVGELVADAVRSAVKCDAAFVAADYFNEVTIPKGAVTNADVLRTLVMPGDTISVVKLTGEQIQRGMERSLFLYPKFNSGFLQVSGMTVTFRADPDVEKRVISIKINGDMLDAARTYHVAMPAPLAKGGLAYFKIWKASDIVKDGNEKTLQIAVNSYLQDHKTISKGEERLVAKAK